MERDPKKRFQSATEMMQELEDYERVQLTGRCTRLQAPQIWKSRFKLMPVIVAFVALQGIIFVLLMLYFRTKK
jgi:hypothetical protein